MSDAAEPADGVSPVVYWYALNPQGFIDAQGNGHPEDVALNGYETCVTFAADQNVSGMTHRYQGSAFVAMRAEELTYLFDPATGLRSAPPSPPAPTLDELKAAKGGDVGAALNDRIATGLLVGGLHVQIDDGARGNLIGLVTMATLVGQGVTTWPEGYSRGWVTAEGPRIPLPTPQDGVQLALAASAYYSGLVQHAQDLVDAVKAAADATALAAVDITAGWPA